MNEYSSLVQTIKSVVEAGGATAIAIAEGVLIVVMLRGLKKAGPALLKLMQEEHIAHQVEVTQITNANKEALTLVAKEHREALHDLMDRHERQYNKILARKRNRPRN